MSEFVWAMTPYQEYIFKSRYSRWVEEKNRRETWDETVGRYLGFFESRIPEGVRTQTLSELRKAILGMEVMPSMRAMMTAGKALAKDHVAAYNLQLFGGG